MHPSREEDPDKWKIQNRRQRVITEQPAARRTYGKLYNRNVLPATEEDATPTRRVKREN
jgi:hypothetical protein